MGLIDALRKLGILRYGSEKATYHNAKERPLALQQDDIYSDKKDVLVNVDASKGKGGVKRSKVPLRKR